MTSNNAKTETVEGAIVPAGGAHVVQYGDFDLGAMEEAEKALPAGGDNKFFDPKEGKNVVRFLPPIAGRKPMVIWHKHFFAAGGEKKSIICTKAQYNQPCPLCDRRLKLASSASKSDQKMARAFEAGAKVCVNMVDMSNPEKGVQVWHISPGLFKKIRSAIDMADVGKVFADPEKGFNIIFKKTGSGLNTEYDSVMVQRQSSPLPNAKELIPTQVDLEQLEQPPSDEEQDSALDGEFESADMRKKGGRSGGRDAGGRDQKKDDDDDLKY